MNPTWPFFFLILLFAAMVFGSDKSYPVDPNLGFATGPGVGQAIPEFTLPDQNGVLRASNDLVGENGAVLNFYRSASW